MTRLTSIRLRLWLPLVLLGAFVVLLSGSALARYWRETARVEATARELVASLLRESLARLEQATQAGDNLTAAAVVAQLGALPHVDTAVVMDGGGPPGIRRPVGGAGLSRDARASGLRAGAA